MVTPVVLVPAILGQGGRRAEIEGGGWLRQRLGGLSRCPRPLPRCPGPQLDQVCTVSRMAPAVGNGARVAMLHGIVMSGSDRAVPVLVIAAASPRLGVPSRSALTEWQAGFFRAGMIPDQPKTLLDALCSQRARLPGLRATAGWANCQGILDS